MDKKIEEHNRKTRLFWAQFDEWEKTDGAKEILYALFKMIKNEAKKEITHLPDENCDKSCAH